MGMRGRIRDKFLGERERGMGYERRAGHICVLLLSFSFSLFLTKDAALVLRYSYRQRKQERIDQASSRNMGREHH